MLEKNKKNLVSSNLKSRGLSVKDYSDLLNNTFKSLSICRKEGGGRR